VPHPPPFRRGRTIAAGNPTCRQRLWTSLMYEREPSITACVGLSRRIEAASVESIVAECKPI